MLYIASKGAALAIAEYRAASILEFVLADVIKYLQSTVDDNSHNYSSVMRISSSKSLLVPKIKIQEDFLLNYFAFLNHFLYKIKNGGNLLYFDIFIIKN